MRSSSKKEDSNSKKKYVFFSDPDVIVQRAENSAATAQVKQDLDVQKQISKDKSLKVPIQFDLKGLENLLSYHPVQPYPFTFISAVKRKLSLGDNPNTCKKVYDPCHRNEIQPPSILKSSSAQNLYQVVQKMDFIRPLKAPDLKITPKSLDFSTKDSVSKELMFAKFEASSKELVHERADRSTKSSERVQRKLDFSTSDCSSIINSEIEPLKVPNISIASNLSKKKEHIRENSREKENRSKRIKKDESLVGKQDEVVQDVFKRCKSPRHISSEIPLSTKLKNDRLSFHMPRESDFASTKPRTKNFATSTAKKDSDKRHKSINIRSLKSARDNSLESKSRICSNESLTERSTKLLDKVTTRESSRNMFESTEYRYKDDFHLLKQTDDQKHTFPPEIKPLKVHKVSSQSQGKAGNIGFKEQTKRVSEKIKPSAHKLEGKIYVVNPKESEDMESVLDSNFSLGARSSCNIISTQQINKDSEKTAQDSNYIDDSLPQCTSTSTKKDDESFTESITTTTKQTSSNNESNNLNESVLSEALLDPRRISFRDGNRSQQDEFCDLVTPDMNLIFRSKRKKQFIQCNDSEADARCSKYTPGKMETGQENIPLMHPTALHMQFQAELHLLDSFNESLRQVMDVEKCLYNVKRDQEKELSTQPNNELKSHFSKIAGDSVGTEHSNETNKLQKHATNDNALTSSKIHRAGHHDTNLRKLNKPIVKAVEVQTQTVNDIATQTDLRSTRRSVQSRCPEMCGITYERGFAGDIEIPQLSLDSAEQFEDLDQIEEISLPSKLRTMSEISLHETTSSIRTETGTEISISTRDVTCSFNKYLDLEIAQLIKDEKQRYDKIEMLFKSREKTLNDRTKKLVKLEEQKRALRDTGQDSRISSVKKKQRALLLKLQQEKDEMNRLKELHKIASQERKLMLQKQRNMFNPQMSTKNILTKLKRSADSQSPRRLSGPMKGYDIRSNSSMSSLVDSDKSQHDRSQTDPRLQISENDLHCPKLELPKGDKFTNFVEESNTSFSKFEKFNEATQRDLSQEKSPYKSQKEGTKSKYEIKSRKFEEKMPSADILRLKSHQHSVESKLIPGHSMSISGQYLFEKEKSPDVSQLLLQNLNKSISEQAKSESDTLVEELSKKSKPSQLTDSHLQSRVSQRERESLSTVMKTETIQEEISSINQDTVSKTSKSSQVSEDILQTHSKNSKKSSKSISTDKDISKKTLYTSESKSSSKRKGSKCQKSKSSSSILTENILRSKSNSQMSEEFIKHHNKRTKVEKEFIHLDKNDENAGLDNTDLNESQSSLQTLVRHSKVIKDKNSKLLSDIINDCESKENILCQKIFERDLGVFENPSYSQERSLQNLDNISVNSQVSTFTISRHSSGESDRNYSKSVVVRSQDHDLKTSKKLEQILNAREAALASRKNCVEEWMAWHAKLRAEEDRVTRMEQAALKLVTATSNVFSQQERSVCHFIDTTVSSDTSDIEGRIELLTEKLAERRIEMSRLKREARKQTKQKLRALEANLLNQIKKYDTTIHEMRKKLDTKKGVMKDSDKLAIESKSLADFKVPEIPLKRIQDLYKNTDLLRSRSESDLLSTKRQPKDIMKNISSLRNGNVEEKSDRNGLQKSTRDTKSVNISEQLSSVRMDTINHSIQSIFDECISEQIECDKLGSASMSSVSDDVRSDKHIHYGAKAYIDEVRSKQTIMSEVEKGSISEDIKTEMSTPKSEADIPTVSETKLSKSDKSETTVQSELAEHKLSLDMSSKQSRAKSISVQSDAEEKHDTEYSEILSEKSQQHAESSNADIKTVETVSGKEILDFSKKLDFLRLNNKNLNEDISSLENELKTLSEMMSRFSKKSNEQSKSEFYKEEKSTSKDISEVFLKSDKIDQLNTVEVAKNDKNKEVEIDQKETNSESSQFLTINAKLKSGSDFKDREHPAKEVDNVISVIMPQDEVSLSKSSLEIDYKARSKEILNEIEKSIISEHIKTTENDLNRSSMLLESNNLSLHKANKELLNDLVSSETDAKSILEIYSKATEDKESISTADDASEAAYSPEEDINIQQGSIDKRDFEDQELLERSKSSLTLLENSNVLDNLTENDISTTKTHSKNKISRTRPADHFNTLERTSEVSKVQSSDKSSSTSEPIESFKYATDHMKDAQEEDKYQGISDGSDSIRKEFKPFTHDESVHADDVEASQKSGETSKNSEDAKHGIHSAARFIADEDSKDENGLELISTGKISFDKEDWTVSDSFDVQQNVADTEWEQSHSQNLNSRSDDCSSEFSDTRDVSQAVDDTNVQRLEENLVSDIEDVSMFIPKGESTNIEAYEMKFDETISDSHVAKSNDELDDILDIIARDNNEEQNQEENVETDNLQKAIHDSVTKILDKVEKSIENNSVKEKIDTHLEMEGNKSEVEAAVDGGSRSISSSPNLKHKSQDEDEIQIAEKKEATSPDINDNEAINAEAPASKFHDEPVIDISVRVEIKDHEGTYHVETKSREIIITELEPGSVECEVLPELEINAKVELAEEEPGKTNALSDEGREDKEHYLEYEDKENTRVKVMQDQKFLEPITEQDSSDGEQLDNLVEIAESGLDTIEKQIESPSDFMSDSKLISHDGSDRYVTKEVRDSEVESKEDITFMSANGLGTVEKSEENLSNMPANVANKTFDVLKDPEYEDISEESLEVSEILDKNEFKKSVASQKSSVIPEKYEALQKSEEVLRILDEIAQKSSTDSESPSEKFQTNVESKQVTKDNEEISSRNDLVSSTSDNKSNEFVGDIHKEKEKLSIDVLDEQASERVVLEENRLAQELVSISTAEEKETDIKHGSEHRVSENCEQDTLSDSSEGRDTPKGVSEIEMDSPRDPNDSRLDIDGLNDDLLSGTNAENQNIDSKTKPNFHPTPIVGTSEKDIEVMIDKLKASLEQPGLEVAELEAKLLRIEQLQIELEIKKLEAEEVSYYVREIPNKPPPPYTPPGGGGRISASLGSPSPPPAVIPSNVDELTAFTEKATALIFKAKEAGEDIMSLEAPPEIYELTKENDETVKKDRRIYNTFLFDLCKETISEIYQAEYEKPGPSWTKPNVKTKPTMKIPRTVDELNEYVSKEVATLFGFKTKLQRENMVMRWSRKRRDRVDELLAREAQAEEDEWTKFHHDELAVKNGLTVAILDTLIMETVNVVKVAYAKKRKIML